MYWLDQLEHEHDNLRTALQSALDRHASEIAGRLCVALGEFWLFRGHFSEGLHWIDSVLSQESALSLAVRMQLLQRAGGLAFQRSDLARARLLYEESLTLARELRDPYLTSTALDGVALMFRKQGNLARARALSEESLTLLRNLGMTKEIPWSLFRLGQVVLRQGKHGEAQALGTECLESFRKLKDSVGVAHVLGLLGEIMSRRGDYEQAATLLRESLTLARDTGVMLVVALGLVRLAGGDTARTHPEQAVRLFSAMERMLDSLDIRMTPAQRAEWDHNVSALCGHLDAEVHEVAWSVGRAMRLEQAIAEALAIGY